MKILLILSSLLLASPIHAETLVQLRNRVDTWLTNHVGGASGLVAKQNTYASNHGGKFWQGLITFSALPAHTAVVVADTSADRLTLHPTDQTESWHDFVPAWDSETFAAAARVDVYDGPSGKGWCLTVWVKYEGTVYSRKKCFGPDVSGDYAWRVEDEPPIP